MRAARSELSAQYAESSEGLAERAVRALLGIPEDQYTFCGTDSYLPKNKREGVFADPSTKHSRLAVFSEAVKVGCPVITFFKVLLY